MLRKGIGLDLGSTRISICTAEEGVILKEPAVAALDVDTGEVMEAGEAALRAVSASPDRLRLCFPLWDPVVKCADILSAMLRIFFKNALGRALLRPRVMVSIPCDLTEAQTNAVEDAVLAAGASRVHLLEAPLCAALGVGVDFATPTGQMLIHIGASRTEAAMIFLGDMVTHVSVTVGGNAFDSAVIRHLRRRHNLLVGKRTAEQIKIRIGNIGSAGEPKLLDVKGRDAETKQPRVVTLSSREMLGAMREPLAGIIDAVVSVVEHTGEDMRADIAKNGILLTGGAVLGDMDQFFADVLGLRVATAPNAATAAAQGAALALERLKNA